jgi:tetratricopeptide (TPR) repeat protein
MKMPEYHDLLRHHGPLLAALDNPGLSGALKAEQGFCEFALGLLDEAITTLREAIELCMVAGNPEDTALAYPWLAWSYLLKGDSERVLELKEEALSKMNKPFPLRPYVFTFVTASNACAFLGRWDEAIENGKEGLDIAQRYSDNSVSTLAASFLVQPFILKGDLRVAEEYGELALEKAPTLADEAWAKGFLGWALCRRGKVEKGIEYLGESLDVFRAGRHRASELYLSCGLAEGYLLAGEYDKARYLSEEIRNLAEQSGAKMILVWTYRLLGQLALETAQPGVAHHFEQAISIAREIKAENELALAYSGMGRYHKQQGNVEEARKYLTDALQIFERLETLIEPDKARKELTELPQ